MYRQRNREDYMKRKGSSEDYVQKKKQRRLRERKRRFRCIDKEKGKKKSRENKEYSSGERDIELRRCEKKKKTQIGKSTK